MYTPGSATPACILCRFFAVTVALSIVECVQVHCLNSVHVLDTHSLRWYSATTTGVHPSARAGERDTTFRHDQYNDQYNGQCNTLYCCDAGYVQSMLVCMQRRFIDKLPAAC
jgi:hypothetical protein